MGRIKILSWNVNGIRAVHKNGTFDTFLSENADIFCVQETKASEDQLPEALIYRKDYDSYFSSAEKKGYSGVALYTKRKPNSVMKGFGIDRFDSEGRILIADYHDFVLFNIYFPNGKMSSERLKYKMEFYDAFLDVAETLNRQGRNIIMCGDVNTAHKEIDLARPKENEKSSGFLPEERAWIDKFISYGYIDTFRLFHNEIDQYTWWDYKTKARERNIGWRIDYFFVNDRLKDNIISADILPNIPGSDHCPISLEIEILE